MWRDCVKPVHDALWQELTATPIEFKLSSGEAFRVVLRSFGLIVVYAASYDIIGRHTTQKSRVDLATNTADRALTQVLSADGDVGTFDGAINLSEGDYGAEATSPVAKILRYGSGGVAFGRIWQESFHSQSLAYAGIVSDRATYVAVHGGSLLAVEAAFRESKRLSLKFRRDKFTGCWVVGHKSGES